VITECQSKNPRSKNTYKQKHLQSTVRQKRKRTITNKGKICMYARGGQRVQIDL